MFGHLPRTRVGGDIMCPERIRERKRPMSAGAREGASLDDFGIFRTKIIDEAGKGAMGRPRVLGGHV